MTRDKIDEYVDWKELNVMVIWDYIIMRYKIPLLEAFVLTEKELQRKVNELMTISVDTTQPVYIKCTIAVDKNLISNVIFQRYMCIRRSEWLQDTWKPVVDSDTIKKVLTLSLLLQKYGVENAQALTEL